MLFFNPLFPQLGATKTEATIIEIAIILCFVALFVDIYRWFSCLRSDHREFDDYVKDIRAMNTYNSYFLGAIIVFFGLIVQQPEPVVSITVLIMFLAAFVFSGCAIFFHPIPKPEGNKATFGIICRWFLALIPTQWTVILGTAGFVSLMISSLSKYP